VSLDNVNVHLVDSTEQVLAFMRWLGERRPDNEIGCDTESTGLDKQKDFARTVQFGDAQTGWTIPLEDWKGVVKEVFQKFDGYIIGHNWPYDDAVLRNANIEPPSRDKIHDTRPMHHPLESTYSTALKNLAARYVDPRAAAAQKELDDAIKVYGWAGIPVTFQPYWVYAALDPVLTKQVKDVIWPRVQAECPRAYDLELAVSWVTSDIERYGIHVDADYAGRAFDKFENYVAETGDWVKNNYGVSAGSNQGVVKALNDLGFEWTKTTASGAAALDKEILAGIDHPLAQTVLRRRQRQKLAKTYLRHFIDERDGDDLIHCSINSIGARTGRMSVQHPALQTLPRRSEKNTDAITIRNCITARPGHTLLMCDFDQIEMRILAYLSKDPSMLAAFLSGDDFFTSMACQLFHLESMLKSDPRRQITKNGGYAKIYGAGTDKFALTAGVTPLEAKTFMQQFDAQFAEVPRFQRDVISTAMRRAQEGGSAYVRSPLTGRKHIADPRKEYALTNYLIQGLAAELFKMKVLEVDAAGLGQWLTMLVHDEVVLDVPNDHVVDAVRILETVMNDIEIIAPVPVSASVSFGQRWGSKQDWNETTWRESLRVAA
jgi:DNA polymerase I